MQALAQLLELKIVKCHHKNWLCKFAYTDPHETKYPGRDQVMDRWITRCVLGLEYTCCDKARGFDGGDEDEWSED